MFSRFTEINEYASDLIPMIFFTATAWSGAQKIADYLFAIWLPQFSGMPLGVLEIMVATVGLYWVLKNQKRR